MKGLIKKFIPSFLLDFYHYSLAVMSAFLYRFPSRKMTVIGITGTSGKSTVVELTTKILEETGYKTASLSSIKFKIGKKEWENTLKMTMPGRFKLQKFLKQALKNNCKYVVLEVTSEGIKQFRHKFIDFDVAVFTNLSPEHIESHGGFEKYREAKLKLFRNTKEIHIINIDDENAEHFLKNPVAEKIGFKISENSKASGEGVSVISASGYNETAKGISFSVKNIEFNLNLLGKFNVYNALAAICVGLSQGVSLEDCKRVLEKVTGIPGRMEVVITLPRAGFTVVVDYAHTPVALEKVYKNLKDNPLICVLGACGGGRDKWKRPVLGKLAGKYCKEVIITNEDPYDESPIEIIEQVAEGAGKGAKKILDRREAVKEALKLANPNDIVVITGKGSEPWMCIAKGRKIPWDDREIVKEEFTRLNPRLSRASLRDNLTG